MTTLNFSTSVCRHCRYYQVEGRRGGMCEQLSVPVRGGWKACSLALPAFASSWEKISLIWEENAFGIKESLSINCALSSPEAELSQENHLSTSETLETDVVLL